MFSKAKIRKVTVGVQRRLCDDLLSELGKEELIHLAKADFEGVLPDEEMALELEAEDRNTKRLVSTLETLFSSLDLKKSVDESPDSPGVCWRDTEKDDIYLRAVSKKVEQFEKLHRDISHKIEQILEQVDREHALNSIGVNSGSLDRMKLCSYLLGTMDGDYAETVAGIGEGSLVRPFGRNLMAVTLAEKKNENLELLKKHGYHDETERIMASELWALPLEHLRHRIQILNRRLRRIEDYCNRMRDVWEMKLRELYGVYLRLGVVIDAQKMFLFSHEALFLSGWIDIRNKTRLKEILKKICGEKYLLMISDKLEIDAPVILKNNRLFRPFELLLKNVGVPGNTELDPTPIAAVTFVLMFGVMFGDIGQGLILVLAGFIIRLIARRSKRDQYFIFNAGIILQICGFSAVGFGLIYGSFFSNEYIIPALWFHPMEHIMFLFFCVIMMGVTFISISIFLNIVNCLKIKDYSTAFFGSRGLPGLMLYAGAVFLFVRYNEVGIIPAAIELIAYILLPVFIFSMRNIVGFFFLGIKPPFPHGVFEYVVETMVEIIEMFSSLLGSTISFIRAGAFALSHAGLGLAIYTLAGIVNPDTFSVAYLTVIVLGNIFIILLEGLICGIQAMRLEYYEIFGKFYKGDGLEFHPFSLKKNKIYNGGVS